MPRRILGTEVAARFPERGPVLAFLIGEAPGPRGADQSGIPFFGDRAGEPVYRALVARGLAAVPDAAFARWDGASLRAHGLRPILRGVALGNAHASCPSDDGERFRAPLDRELAAPENLARLRRDLGRASRRCPTVLRVIAFGRRAEWLLARLAQPGAPVPEIDLHVLPHPSAQGLLQAAPGKGKGLRLDDLRATWRARLEALLPAGPLSRGAPR